ncbi:MAG: phenylalanine--tRNA ligase subunit beta [Candidatus Fluviicola riflensis]|nr:MAG: phenylalanine--tRNA ligase subunit beta [Candidatus Fluviicola riflensis]OGS79414.1 MAG: phenylalanine--tRNA ligase subunit beta [Candidatus Fluviicola riflensis]OGS86846.1 MAG: phenylalanine--tRNA ligase subunit beta [Fluviicola sp. RIFCSPHIGHO2_01_FULL_43_53]OGS89636.1 MAG: phenylalanine--tRNA ligase subunit beta [Fluviicola sp. RIFCSPHIGHO2_12_FULL_43_24]
MKISYNWLQQFLPNAIEPETLGEILTDTGLEVEGLETLEAVKGGLEGVIVAEVLTCEKHPNADKLKVTTVNTGKEVVQVVCGAPNVAAGQKVILATVGSTLYPSPDQPLKIKVSKIRDVESFGMLCAEDELGLGESHDGILVLPANAVVGTPAAVFLELENDVQIEIGLTPNRSDAMGHIGVARDILAHAAVHKGATDRLILPQVKTITKTADLSIVVGVEDTERCPRYMAVTLKGVAVKPSPAWLQKRLRAVGLSPINNVVDVTNFVMRELGTPLHAFDAAKVGSKLVVRTAAEGEKMVTLDGVERTLNSEDLLITNGTTPLCIAGVFGGLDSGIQDQTTDVLLEAAYFQPVSVRKTAKRHTLSTDASFRFERGVDVDLVPYALARAVELIREVAGGEVGMEVVDLYPNPIQPRKVSLRFARCKQVLGHEIPVAAIKTILTALDFTINSETPEALELTVPNYRTDVDREIDVIEELLRIYGFNQVPFPEKLNTSLVLTEKPDLERLTTNLSEVLTGLGFSEMMNNSLTTPTYTEKFGKEQLSPENNVTMLNPLSQDLAVMRQSLVFQALETVAHNQNRQQADVRLFEFGKVYQQKNGEYFENKRLTLVISGRKTDESWASGNDKVSLFTLKGAVNALLQRLGLDSLANEEGQTDHDLFTDGLTLRVLKNSIGSLGWVNPSVRKHFGVKQDVFVADLDWDAILNSLKLTKVQYKELPKTFEVRRDYSLLLDQAVSFASIEQLARKADKKILQKVNLFDVYEGKNLPEGKKSYAVSFTFQDQEQTLKDEQVDRIMEAIRVSLETELGAELRK